MASVLLAASWVLGVAVLVQHSVKSGEGADPVVVVEQKTRTAVFEKYYHVQTGELQMVHGGYLMAESTGL